ncbi:uncharacterized protein LY89DRAFT_783419 [Mollisia scopiformis]|uniref:NAD dependent epimerase/dehydratase n=1 Tax=Mollisia scopiformis TaxID=149040 RepID=A0A194X4X6_MOLSC|nr:uncharacterized protein LY89DRAFT_783419 [Mollisia scopiformis]KUJ15231.1 hypothetical protein LY89DRAFT_783419 [Mollisia scopiformis]
MGQQPSIPTDLSRELQVIGAGFSRTGTVSFSMALERLLQGPVCHSGTAVLMREEEYIKSWIKIQQPGASQEVINENLRSLTAGYVATTDTPATFFTEELTKLYPNAIVICTTRERAAWWKSAQALTKNINLWWLDAMLWPMPTLRYFAKWRDSCGDRIEIAYQRPKEDMDGPQLLDIHEDYVRRVVPPERLFFFNVKEGWGPLCKILNCPVPDEPFPRANDAGAMQEFFEGVVKKALLKWAQMFGVVGVGIGVGVWCLKHWRGVCCEALE